MGFCYQLFKLLSANATNQTSDYSLEIKQRYTKEEGKGVKMRSSPVVNIFTRYFTFKTFGILGLSGSSLALHFGCWVVSLNYTSNIYLYLYIKILLSYLGVLFIIFFWKWYLSCIRFGSFSPACDLPSYSHRAGICSSTKTNIKGTSLSVPFPLFFLLFPYFVYIFSLFLLIMLGRDYRFCGRICWASSNIT